MTVIRTIKHWRCGNAPCTTCYDQIEGLPESKYRLSATEYLYLCGDTPPHYPMPQTNALFLATHMPWYTHHLKQVLKAAIEHDNRRREAIRKGYDPDAKEPPRNRRR